MLDNIIVGFRSFCMGYFPFISVGMVQGIGLCYLIIWSIYIAVDQISRTLLSLMRSMEWQQNQFATHAASTYNLYNKLIHS